MLMLTTCHTELAGQRAGISKKRTVFFTRCCLVRDILLFGWSENFSHQGPEHGHIDNCKSLRNCTNNKEVYLTVLGAHSHEGHLWSLEADLVDAAAKDEGEVAEENSPRGSAKTLDRSSAYRPRATLSGLRGS